MITSYFITLGSCPVSWKMKKQTTISRSFAEAEHHSMADTTIELIWLRSLLCSHGIEHPRPMEIACGNKVALHITANPLLHEWTKHIKIDCHFIRDHLILNKATSLHITPQMHFSLPTDCDRPPHNFLLANTVPSQRRVVSI